MKSSRFFVAALCLGGMIVCLTACAEKIRPSVLPGIDTKHGPQQESWHSTILVTDSGKVQAKIIAGYIRKFDGPQETLMDSGVVVLFYNELGKQTTTMTAKSGKVNEQTYNIDAYGNVLVVSDDSTRLRSDRLFWDNGRRLIHTPDFVSVTSLKEKVQGQGFESDQRLKNYRIFKVTAQVRAE
jgi:LPS export ABC transporter protein LptC